MGFWGGAQGRREQTQQQQQQRQAVQTQTEQTRLIGEPEIRHPARQRGHLYRLVGEERRVAGGHLVHQHAECPPVDRLVVALAEDDLGRQVLGRTAQRPGATLDALGEPEIGHLQVALGVDQQVFRLEIAIDQVEIVEILERQHDLGGVEARVRLREAADLPQVREHLTAGDVLQHHVQVGVVLEVELQTDQERERDGLQDALLVQRVLDLLQLDHLLSSLARRKHWYSSSKWCWLSYWPLPTPRTVAPTSTGQQTPPQTLREVEMPLPPPRDEIPTTLALRTMAEVHHRAMAPPSVPHCWRILFHHLRHYRPHQHPHPPLTPATRWRCDGDDGCHREPIDGGPTIMPPGCVGGGGGCVLPVDFILLLLPDGGGFQPPLYAVGSPYTAGGPAAPLIAAIRCKLLLPDERILLGKGPRRCANSGFSDLLEKSSRSGVIFFRRPGRRSAALAATTGCGDVPTASVGVEGLPVVGVVCGMPELGTGPAEAGPEAPPAPMAAAAAAEAAATAAATAAAECGTLLPWPAPGGTPGGSFVCRPRWGACGGGPCPSMFGGMPKPTGGMR
uniref:Uncharacterized protein n=1 Tax=Anopheles atroparvus TaxID=41427 RepID=A0A182INX3_ANOAO